MRKRERERAGEREKAHKGRAKRGREKPKQVVSTEPNGGSNTTTRSGLELKSRVRNLTK